MQDPLHHWFDAISLFTKPLVEDPDDHDGEALTLFAQQALAASNSKSAAVFMPTVGGVWLCEAAATLSDEGGASALIGAAFDLGDAQRQLLTEGETLPLGPQLFVPLKIQGALQGCLVLERAEQDLPFTSSDRQLAMAYGRQGALALDLIGSRQAHDLAVLFEERERISRDLHDLGIQHLFATGMLLQKLKAEVDAGLSPRKTKNGLQEAMERLDEAVHQIRNIVYRLRDEDASVGLVDAVEREATVARSNLGFAPTITFEVDEVQIRPGSQEMQQLRTRAPELVNESLSEDVVAVIRESLTNIARHAGAHSAQVKVSLFGAGPTGEIEVLIVDDGAGVDPSQSRSSGIANMQRRAANHGGSFAVGAGPRGRGTSLVWRSPLE